ncbi:hypothetical protein AB6J89_004714 [Salmonella enterica]|jgi:hypothetical protein
MKPLLLCLALVLATVNLAVATVAAPGVFAMQIIAGAWRGFRNASYIMRKWYVGIIKNYLEGIKQL